MNEYLEYFTEISIIWLENCRTNKTCKT